ncbi:MAG: hypothetical protein H6908_06040 [Hyphomicrobiales bacterium]|nr:hypothetical protein [Hyphomicrobiales bacterium]
MPDAIPLEQTPAWSFYQVIAKSDPLKILTAADKSGDQHTENIRYIACRDDVEAGNPKRISGIMTGEESKMTYYLFLERDNAESLAQVNRVLNSGLADTNIGIKDWPAPGGPFEEAMPRKVVVAKAENIEEIIMILDIQAQQINHTAFASRINPSGPEPQRR